MRSKGVYERDAEMGREKKNKITTLRLASRVKQVPLKRQRVLWRVLGVNGNKPVRKSRRWTDGDELGKEEPEEQKRGTGNIKEPQLITMFKNREREKPNSRSSPHDNGLKGHGEENVFNMVGNSSTL